MALLDTWRNLAYQTEMDNKTANEFWGSYFTQEKAIYEQIKELLKNLLISMEWKCFL